MLGRTSIWYDFCAEHRCRDAGAVQVCLWQPHPEVTWAGPDHGSAGQGEARDGGAGQQHDGWKWVCLSYMIVSYLQTVISSSPNFLYSVFLPHCILLDFPSVTTLTSFPFLRLWHRPPPMKSFYHSTSVVICYVRRVYNFIPFNFCCYLLGMKSLYHSTFIVTFPEK